MGKGKLQVLHVISSNHASMHAHQLQKSKGEHHNWVSHAAHVACKKNIDGHKNNVQHHVSSGWGWTHDIVHQHAVKCCFLFSTTHGFWLLGIIIAQYSRHTFSMTANCHDMAFLVKVVWLQNFKVFKHTNFLSGQCWLWGTAKQRHTWIIRWWLFN